MTKSQGLEIPLAPQISVNGLEKPLGLGVAKNGLENPPYEQLGAMD